MKHVAIVLLLLAACAAREPKPAQTSSAGAPAKQLAAAGWLNVGRA